MNTRGQALIEYLLIITIIRLLVMLFITTFGGFIKDNFTELLC